MDFIAVLSLAAAGGLWPPPAPVPPDAITLGLRILAIAEGTPKDRVEDRLGLTGCVPFMVVGTTISHTYTYAIGRTHTLTLHYASGANGWEFHTAKLEATEIDWSLPWERGRKP